MNNNVNQNWQNQPQNIQRTNFAQNDTLTTIGIVLGFISAIIVSFSIILLPFTIWTMVILSKLNQGDQSKRVTAGVLTLLFCWIIPGVFILVGSTVQNQNSVENQYNRYQGNQQQGYDQYNNK